MGEGVEAKDEEKIQEHGRDDERFNGGIEISKRPGKKGAITDFFLIPVVIFALVVAFPPIYASMAQVWPGLQSTVPAGSVASNNYGIAAGLVHNYDLVFLFVVLGFGLAIIISSFFVESHPAFFFISLILGVIAFSITPLFADIYNQYIVGFTNPNFDPSVDMPVTTFIIQHFPEYMVGVILMTFVALYAKFVRGKD